MDSPIEEIKSRLDIVDVIGSYIKLKKAGANYRALCPFHSEKTPSFFVSPSRQMWHCFGCGVGHGLFDFVMKIEGVEFGDALRILARKANIQLKPMDRKSAIYKSERQRFYEICEIATKFFEKQLASSQQGKKANEYLLKRGITQESIKSWRLGWAPETWHGLSGFLASKGYQKEEIEKAGLSVKNEKGNYYDRFRARIMFPVFDFNSQIIGFGARILDKKKDIAKYVNTPATMLYDKSRVLYGIDRAKMELRQKDCCILVEGYVDVIFGHQAGFANVVATSGTALTNYQLNIIKRYTNNILLSFDMDFAGDQATKRGIDLAQTRDFNLKVMNLPQGKDPADVISDNPVKFKELISDSLSILDFYFQDALLKHDSKTARGKKEISNILLPVIKKIPNKIEQSHWVQQLSRKLNVSEKDVLEEMKRQSLDEKGDVEISLVDTPNPAFQKTRDELLEERMLSLMLKDIKNLELFNEESVSFLSVKSKEIIDNFQSKDKLSLQANDFLSYLYLKADAEEIEKESIAPEIEFCLREIKSLKIKNEMNEMSLKIREAEENNDIEKVKSLTEKFSQLSKQIISE